MAHDDEDLPARVRKTGSLKTRGPQTDGTLACPVSPRGTARPDVAIRHSSAAHKPPRTIDDKLARLKIWL